MMKRPFATIILAAGKGTRMGSSDKHKVCFSVLGVPVIIRTLETYNLCGSTLNLVVVGALAESVMATVNHRLPGTAYAFQESQKGTGDAARKGAEILERMQFQGDVLVVAGDKVIAPKVIRQLLSVHERTGADVTLATAKRPPQSSAGILLKNAQGNIVGILEEAERQRIAALGKIQAAFGKSTQLPRNTVEGILAALCSEQTAKRVAAELCRVENQKSKIENPNTLERAVFEERFTGDERQGLVRIAAEPVRAERLLERCDQMNLSTYLFRAPVLYEALSQLKSNRANQEEYLTDVFELLAKRKPAARVVGCTIEDPRDLMAFNNPQELLAIEDVFRRREGQAISEAPSDQAQSIAPAST